MTDITADTSSTQGSPDAGARHLYSDMYLAQADGLRFSVVAHFPASG
jgi:hypothetical protein